MRKALFVSAALCVLVGLGVGSMAYGNMAVKGDDPAMMASPQTIVLDKVGGVTVHTNIPAATVVPSTVTLNGVAPVGSVCADDCGHLAARFAVADLGLAPGEAALTLCGTYVGGGDSFAVEDVVRVK